MPDRDEPLPDSPKPKPKVVLDSGIIVSAFLSDKGLASDLLTICGENAYLYTSEEILQEIRSTLIEKRRIRNKYLYSDQDVEDFIETFIEMSTIIENLPDIHVIERDPEDNKILACALTAYADYIVSRDLDLLDLKIYNRIKIIAPEDFIWYLRSI